MGIFLFIGMLIRKAKLKDIPCIVKLWREFMKDHDAIYLAKRPERKPRMRRREEAPELFGKFVKKNIHSKNGVVLVVEEDDALVGYAIMYLKKDPPVYVENTNAYISDLFVKREHRGKKASSMMKDEMFAWAERKGERNLSLHAFMANEHARRIYRKWGFEDVTVDMRKRL